MKVSAKEVVDAVFAEALKRDKDYEKRWVVLVDEEIKKIKIIKNWLKNNKNAIIILDVIHVIKNLRSVSRILFNENSQDCAVWLQEKLIEILNDNAWAVEASMKRSAVGRNINGELRATLDALVSYILDNKKSMNYDQYLKEGIIIVQVL